MLGALALAAVLGLYPLLPACAWPDQFFSPPREAVESFYRVKQGDTLWDIARRCGLDAATLAAANGLATCDYIVAGQYLAIPGGVVVHRVAEGETLWDIATRYKVPVAVLAARNDLANPDYLEVGQEIFVPVKDGSSPVAAVPGEPLAALDWPVYGPLTSLYGPRGEGMHHGIDIAADGGTLIRAARHGRVVHAGPAGTYGLLVVLDHGNGVTTCYGHCAAVLVEAGAEVRAGQPVALVGSTGRSTGPHLHFEVRVDGRAVDPLPYLLRPDVNNWA